tara:strand:- start:106 stop:588 length:483 start_codon:yes stop_codon:yes gene_type:complete
MLEPKKKRVRIFTEEQKAKNADRTKAWKIKNLKASLEYISQWRNENKERTAITNRKWQKENPDKISEHRRNRRAKKIMSFGRHTAEEIYLIFVFQRGLCANCEKKLFKSGKNKYHVDHIMPLIRGGNNDKYNLQCLCPSCNLRKSSKDPIDWAGKNDRLL